MDSEAPSLNINEIKSSYYNFYTRQGGLGINHSSLLSENRMMDGIDQTNHMSNAMKFIKSSSGSYDDSMIGTDEHAK